ncbi:carbohydrate kinase [Pontibacter sp. 172403-2]|uniref:FGGY-family carbohydrate kinase n=1 Tax=Pontibacter rufus TaxID=2791028 RepID=UPI0018AF6087|nr:FGGY family carbohydrate kinase [Pontibacter sp. 172403-2]MBF9255097.1 carbohydrate kinase [Pontibacter sp. 172403-2]
MVPCIAIFDIGKTNKKFLLFDQQYKIIKEEEVYIDEIIDDDGEKGEDLETLTNWLHTTWKVLEADYTYDVLAVNFTAYGASLVHVDENGKPVTPLYNYLKPFPAALEKKFYDTYGDKLTLAAQTSSPPLGMLNSGLQLYWLKYEKPELFKQIKYTLHLPQYVSSLFTGQFVTEYTGVGCHTALWDFQKKDYHTWVYAEGFDKLFPPMQSHYRALKTTFRYKKIPAGIGLHDSSSALIPYLKQFSDPFLLLSTGTWGITLNAFAKKPLTPSDLQHDCLQYLTYHGNPVKASRKFIGNIHEEQVRLLADYYQKPALYYKTVRYDEGLLQDSSGLAHHQSHIPVTDKPIISAKINLDLDLYPSYEAAYHELIVQLFRLQLDSIYLAAEDDINNFQTLLVDGGFSKNHIFMTLLGKAFPGLEIKAALSAQGTALGAALVMNIWLYFISKKGPAESAIK